MFLKLWYLFLTIVSGCHFINAGQFRGGILSAKATNHVDQIKVTYRLSFERSYYGNQDCNYIQQALEVEGFLSSKQGCQTDSISPLPFICTESSANDDWISGMYNMTFACSSMFVHIGYTGRQWASVNNGGGAWSLLLSANVSLRSDTRRKNTSPIAVMPPITRILRDCEQVIKIPVTDEDNDILRCRWSSSETVDECGGICEPMPSIILDEEKCTLYYSGNISISGLFAVAIQIEDYPSNRTDEPMSSVPLQFLIEVLDGEIPCSGIPNISVADASNKPQIIDVFVDSNFTARIFANADYSDNRHVGIETISPIGMIKGSLERIKYSPDVLSSYLDVSWTPAFDQQGRHLFCFMAVIESRWQSKLGCKILQVISEQLTSPQSTEKTTRISESTNANNETFTTGAIVNSTISTVTTDRSDDQGSTIYKTSISRDTNHATEPTKMSSASSAQKSTTVYTTPAMQESSSGMFSSQETSSTKQTILTNVMTTTQKSGSAQGATTEEKLLTKEMTNNQQTSYTQKTQSTMNVTTFTKAEWIIESSTTKIGEEETATDTTFQGKTDETSILSTTDETIQSTQVQTSYMFSLQETSTTNETILTNVTTTHQSGSAEMTPSTQIQTITARVDIQGYRENFAFLGGTMYVAIKDSSKAQFLLRYRLTFYYEHADFNICTNTVNPFLNKSIISMRLVTNSECKAVFQENIPILCTEISKVFNWFSGEGSATFQCSSRFSEIEMMGNAGNWTLTASSSLVIRSDTKKVNNPPLAEMLPIQRILLGCQTTIKIPVIDQDNDIIRCRWDDNSQNDNYRDAYQRNSGLFLSEVTCSIHINDTMVQDGPHRLAVLVEDFTDDSAKIPMSSSSLKFIVEVLKENLTCDVLPMIQESSFQDGPVLIKVGSTYTKRLTASSKPQNEIVAIDKLSPQGMVQSPLNETNECPSSYEEIGKSDGLRKCWFVEIIWVPSENGKYLLCFFAVNDLYLTSPQQCKELSVDVDTEEYKENGEWTTGDIVGLVFGILATLLAIPGTVIAVWQIRKCREQKNIAKNYL